MIYEKMREYTINDLENIFDTLPLILWIQDEAGMYKYINQAFTSKSQLKKEEIINKDNYEISNLPFSNVFYKYSADILAKNKSMYTNEEFIIKGKKLSFQVFSSPFKASNSSSRWILFIAREDTLSQKIRNNFYNDISIDTKSFFSKTIDAYSYNTNDDILSPDNNDFNFISQHISDKEYAFRIKQILVHLLEKLNGKGMDILLYDKNKLLPYVSVGKTFLKKFSNIPFSINDINFILKNNVYENIHFVNHNHIFKHFSQKYYENNYIQSFSISYGHELIGILNVYYINKTNITLNDFIKSTCYRLGVLLTNKILKKKLDYQFQKYIEVNNKLKSFLETATDLCGTINFDGSIIDVNYNFFNILGWSREELISKKIQDFVPPDSIESVSKFLSEIIHSNKAKGFGFIAKCKCKDGSYKTFLWNWEVLTNNKDLILTGKDVTNEWKLKSEKENLQNKLNLEKFKNNLLDNISHEFKTPLNIILTACQIININKKNSDTTNNMSKYTKSITQNSYRLLRLVNNLLDLSSIKHECNSSHYTNCNIVNLIEDIVSSVADHIIGKKRRIIFDTTEEEIILCCDPERIETIMLNLLSNAVKFTSENGLIEVNISLSSDSNNVIISVKDDGDKIDPQFAETIFERFTQEDDLFTRRCEGIGLGLALVKSCVEMHHGKVWANTDVEHGAEIIFTLPIRLLVNKNSISKPSKISTNSNIDRFNIEFADIYNL